MKVIFLDHDGVICLPNNWGSRFKRDMKFDSLDTKAVNVLNKILEETDADIVVSSDWRLFGTLEELSEHYKKYGIIKSPIAVTPNYKDLVKSNYTEFGRLSEHNLEAFRSIEIRHYLDNTPGITHWVAIDDLDMRKFLTNFVYIHNTMEGIKKLDIRKQILKYLVD
jgi:hypothetical protein